MANWQTFDSKLNKYKGSLDAYWILAADLTQLPEAVAQCDHIRVTVVGSWQLLPGLIDKCGPDGLANAPIPGEALILSSCAPGAVVGKIGGSSAALEVPVTPDAGEEAEPQPTMFGIGSYCIVRLKDLPKGPLFVGINTKHRPLTIETLTVTLEGAILA